MLSRILPIIAVAIVLAIAVPIHAAPINVAFGADVTSPDPVIEPWLLSNLVDGNYTTGGQVRNNTASYEFDIHTPATVDTMHFEGYSTLYLFPEYKLLGKLASGDDWTPLLHVTGNTDVSRTTTFGAFQGQYFQFWVVDCAWSAPYWMEFELYTPEPATLTLLALGSLAVLRRRRKQ